MMVTKKFVTVKNERKVLRQEKGSRHELHRPISCSHIKVALSLPINLFPKQIIFKI